MRPLSALSALVDRQHGVISRAQLLALGVAARTIQHWRARGLLHDVHVGVYAWGHRAVSWHGRCVAALLAAGQGAAISHAAAAVLHGLMAPRPTIDVISLRRRKGDGTLRVHRGSLADDEITEREGIRVTTVERTLFDLCDPRLVTEAIAKGLTTLSSLNEFVDRKRGVPGARRFAKVLGLPQYRSNFERHFHRWLQSRGFPEPAVNEKVGRRTFDFVWPERRLIVETDGPHHRTPQQLADDERAAAEAARHGFRVLRAPEEGFDHRRDRVEREIWAALEDDRGRMVASIGLEASRIKRATSVLGSEMSANSYPTAQPGKLQPVIRRAIALLALLCAAAPAAASAAVTVTGRAVTGTEGTEINATVASGTSTKKVSACLRATIDWGDGASSNGTIPASGGSFTVRGRHTYAMAGHPDLVTTVRDICTPSTVSAHSPVTINDAALTATGTPVSAYARYPATVVVATFTDANALSKASDFTATVDWGDGTSGPASVSTRPGGGYQVTGTTTYKMADSYPVAVAINDAGGSTASATTTATISSAPPPAHLLGVGAAPQRDPLVRAYAPNGDLVLNFRAYPKRMTSGVRVATGDVNGDGAADIITAPGSRGRAVVQVYSGVDGHRLRRFRAFIGKFHAGIYVAAGDVDGDGHADIIVGAGEGGRPIVRVFSGATGGRIGQFFARRHTARVGVRVAAGDMDGDGRAEIATAGGPRAGNTITIFHADGTRVARLHPSLRAHRGLFLAMGDLNGDELADVAIGGDAVVVALGADGRRLGAWRPFGTGAHGRGLRVGIADVNADGTPEIAVSRLRHGATLRAFTAGTWKRVSGLLGGHPPPGAVYLG